MMYCVSSYEHASRQLRGAIRWENPLPNNNISLPHHLPLTPSTLLHSGTVKLNQVFVYVDLLSVVFVFFVFVIDLMVSIDFVLRTVHKVLL